MPVCLPYIYKSTPKLSHNHSRRALVIWRSYFDLPCSTCLSGSPRMYGEEVVT
jgi:hypothetical protein